MTDLLLFADRRHDAALAHAAAACLGSALSEPTRCPMARFLKHSATDGPDVAEVSDPNVESILRDDMTSHEAVTATFRALMEDAVASGNEEFAHALRRCEHVCAAPGSTCAFASLRALDR